MGAKNSVAAKENHMEISKKDLDDAVKRGEINSKQADLLWDAFSNKEVDTAGFTLSKVAYFLGALLVISSMSWLMTLGWSWFGGPALFLIALFYAICLFSIGYSLWQKKAYKIPGGLLVTAAVCMTPLAIYGLENFTGEDNFYLFRNFFWWSDSHFFAMEIATLIVGVIALWFVPFPFLMVPIILALWNLALDFSSLLYGKDNSWLRQCWVSLWYGLALLCFSFIIDRKTKQDFAFWGYLFGTLGLWIGLTCVSLDTEKEYFIYFLCSLAMMFLSVLMQRRVLLVFGAMGLVIYLGHLAYDSFKDSIWFPFALSAIGLLVIGAGILFQKHGAKIEKAILNMVPASLQRFLPQNRKKV